ncbi:hypothetical protein GCM10010218_10250 [Streptomyces mashuensis]|uniref:SCO6045-like C-terminal domain-containing protein n=1 Tax=Streptomyces mashuensis TaxID=33904 RepID=A0A919AXV7_9ACTN|nr:hypothetical protein GCM10010218_10250 [Streptomyces mashuensis]
MPVSDRSTAYGGGTDAARERLALAQHALLSSLVAGAPDPEGFDRRRLEVQRQALLTKRAAVVAKLDPELPRLLGEEYRELFLAYARPRPMTGGYHQDARDFVAHLLDAGLPEDSRHRERLAAHAAAGHDDAGVLRRLRRRLRRFLSA